MKKKLDDIEPDAYPAVLQRNPNVRLRDSAVYVAYWRTNGKQIDFPDEDNARQGWHSNDADELIATCPLVEPTEPTKG